VVYVLAGAVTLASAQVNRSTKLSSFSVIDTATNRPVSPGQTIDLGLAAPLEIKQRVFNICNNSSTTMFLSSFSIIQSGQTFYFGFTPLPPTGGTAEVLPGLCSSFGVDATSATPGTYSATVFFSSSFDNFSFNTQVRVLENGPAIQVYTLSGTRITKNSTFNFGTTPAGTALDQTFLIINNGTQTLNINNVNVSGSGYSLLSPPANSVIAGGQTSFTIRLLSSDGGTKIGSVSIGNNDPNDNPFTFSLTGSVTVVTQPNIQVETLSGVPIAKNSTFDVGSTPVNIPLDVTFRIRNTGTATLNIGNPIVSGSGFSLLIAPDSQSILPGQSTTFTVRLLSGSASTNSGSVSISSNDPNDSPYAFILTGAVVANPEPNIQIKCPNSSIISNGGSCNFGSTPINVPLDKTFYVLNTGTAMLNISSFSLSGGDYSIIQPPSSNVGPGASTPFVIRLLSNTAGTKLATFSISSNDPDDNAFHFTINGTVTGPPAPEIRVTATATGQNITDGGSYTFDTTTPPGTPISRLFSIYNDGNATLHIDSISVSPNSGFSIIAILLPDGTSIALPTDIAPGGSINFRVRLLSSTPGPKTGVVSIGNNDADENPFDFTVNGTVQ
jgi:hypothetical protein